MSMKAPLIQLIGLVLAQVILATSKQSLRILGLLPYHGKSHWQVYQPIFEELARRGHNVTIVGHYPRQIPMENYNDISIADEKESGVHYIMDVGVMDSLSDFMSIRGMFHDLEKFICRGGLRHPKVKALIKSDEKFDVIVTEVFSADCFLGFVYKFNAPFLGLKSGSPCPWVNDRISNPDNPSYIPHSLIGQKSKMNFWQRVENLVSVLLYKLNGIIDTGT